MYRVEHYRTVVNRGYNWIEQLVVCFIPCYLQHVQIRAGLLWQEYMVCAYKLEFFSLGWSPQFSQNFYFFNTCKILVRGSFGYRKFSVTVVQNSRFWLAGSQNDRKSKGLSIVNFQISKWPSFKMGKIENCQNSKIHYGRQSKITNIKMAVNIKWSSIEMAGIDYDRY